MEKEKEEIDTIVLRYDDIEKVFAKSNIKNYEGLIDTFKEAFNLKKYNLIINYCDEDDDKVKIESDDDFKNFLKSADEENNIIEATINGKKIEDNNIINKLNNEDKESEIEKLKKEIEKMKNEQKEIKFKYQEELKQKENLINELQKKEQEDKKKFDEIIKKIKEEYSKLMNEFNEIKLKKQELEEELEKNKINENVNKEQKINKQQNNDEERNKNIKEIMKLAYGLKEQEKEKPKINNQLIFDQMNQQSQIYKQKLNEIKEKCNREMNERYTKLFQEKMKGKV